VPALIEFVPAAAPAVPPTPMFAWAKEYEVEARRTAATVNVVSFFIVHSPM
jgi:hypothetical protein